MSSQARTGLRIVCDMFCGICGYSIGAKRKGHKIGLLIDNNAEICQLATINFPEAEVLNLTIGTPESRKILLEKLKKYDKKTLHIHANWKNITFV